MKRSPLPIRPAAATPNHSINTSLTLETAMGRGFVPRAAALARADYSRLSVELSKNWRGGAQF
jgi:hypothetical protein